LFTRASAEDVSIAPAAAEVDMHKACVVLVLVTVVIPCFGQQTGHETVTISGCLMNTNGRFKLLTQGQTYVLKGHQNELFSYNGMLVEVTGTVEAAKSHSPGMPMILHITKVKKLADTCM
jgi:hypothetical protein